MQSLAAVCGHNLYPPKIGPLAPRLSRPSLKVVGTDTDRSAACDFLLVIRSNYGPISYMFNCFIVFALFSLLLTSVNICVLTMGGWSRWLWLSDMQPSIDIFFAMCIIICRFSYGK